MLVFLKCRDIHTKFDDIMHERGKVRMKEERERRK
jgi:hypothetical protein